MKRKLRKKGHFDRKIIVIRLQPRGYAPLSITLWHFFFVQLQQAFQPLNVAGLICRRYFTRTSICWLLDFPVVGGW